MALHDAPHRGQAHAGARELAGAVQALEEAEQTVRRAHVKARAVVAHHKGRARTMRHAVQRDVGAQAACAVLPGIAQQVLQHQAQQGGVALGDEARLDLDVGGPFRGAAPQVVHHEAGQLREVHRLAGQRLLRELGQRQQRVDHLVHARGSAEHAVQVVVADPVELAAVVFLDDAGEAFHHPDRRPQIVRDGEAEVVRLGRGLRGAQRCTGVQGGPLRLRRRIGLQHLPALGAQLGHEGRRFAHSISACTASSAVLGVFAAAVASGGRVGVPDAG
jgi:hypothetical protein